MVAGSSSKSSNHSEEFQRLTTTLPSTSSSIQFGPEAEIQEMADEPTKEHQNFKHVDEPENEAEISEKATFYENAMEPRKETETCEEMVVGFGEAVEQSQNFGSEAGTITISPTIPRQKEFKGSRFTKDSIPLSEIAQILQTQPNNVSAEQVEFLEEAIRLFSTYVEKSKECLKRKDAITELKRQMQALEDENEAAASSAPRFE